MLQGPPQTSAGENSRIGNTPPPTRYAVFDRDTKNQVELFRPGKCAVRNRGSETLPAIPETQPARSRCSFGARKRRWCRWAAIWRNRTARCGRRPGNSWPNAGSGGGQIRRHLRSAHQLRQQTAQNAGFENYRDYAFRRLGRFDYTPDDCEQFHDAVEKESCRSCANFRLDGAPPSNSDNLRPWDLAVDPLNRPPLKPFAAGRRDGFAHAEHF